ncbi:hypothetical protein [Lentilactobacillus kosonis]|uniref:MucBP domain-containing protein n=1 Tax=Lentilactobacillus kosonis TaxID=2810561 RepID=A0A401FPZ0_9LACO|nr:hypothetical protein [Lentilactobacillus kosonis]GAY74386.1 hypothetical protein NBRC111893_2532 [Lentilactobacillus kosonis]
MEYYVKLQAPHIVYEGPNGRPLKTKLRSNLIIKVFLKVITSTDEVWYNIGGSQWINGVQSRQSEAPVGVATKPITRLISQVTELTGYIDFIDHQLVNVYDQPYGKIKNQIISGTTVTISSVMIDDQQIKWYTIGESEVIPARYVIIK